MVVICKRVKVDLLTLGPLWTSEIFMEWSSIYNKLVLLVIVFVG